MKNLIFYFLLICQFAVAQVTIKGTVTDGNTPLEGAAVYVNNSMIGTTTDINGKFELPIGNGVYELVVSYIGFKKILYTVDSSTYKNPIKFILTEDEEQLNEIIIKKVVYDEKWKNNLLTFKRDFLGFDELAEECEIVHEKDLFFDFNNTTKVLQAFARKPIIIKNKALGYLITFDLEFFERSENRISYLGYTRYQQIKGSKRKVRRWEKQRLKAYLGSHVHFFKSITDNTFKEEGFVVNQFRRVPNPERPSEEEIRQARKIIIDHRTQIINSGNKVFSDPKINQAAEILKKSRLPKFRDFLYRTALSLEDIASVTEIETQLTFENNLSIVYKNEKENPLYVATSSFGSKREPRFQTSAIVPLESPLIIDKLGILINPLAVNFEGYWSFEKFAHSLPLDYEPKTED